MLSKNHIKKPLNLSGFFSALISSNGGLCGHDAAHVSYGLFSNVYRARFYTGYWPHKALSNAPLLDNLAPHK